MYPVLVCEWGKEENKFAFNFQGTIILQWPEIWVGFQVSLDLN